MGLAFWRTVHDVPRPAERQGSHGGGPTHRIRRTRHVSHALDERRWGCRRSGPAWEDDCPLVWLLLLVEGPLVWACVWALLLLLPLLVLAPPAVCGGGGGGFMGACMVSRFEVEPRIRVSRVARRGGEEWVSRRALCGSDKSNSQGCTEG